MIDLKAQYMMMKSDIDSAIQKVINSGNFIGQDIDLINNLQEYTGYQYCIPCANGTDALEIAICSSGPDELIMPVFGYISALEMASIHQRYIKFIDVDYETFNINSDSIVEGEYVVSMGLFGMPCHVDSYFHIQDYAQCFGAKMTGDIVTTSFFPTKNLGCYGDGGAIFTNDIRHAEYMKEYANHGQTKRFEHKIIGRNSRLDKIQAAILNAKLQYLDIEIKSRRIIAKTYDECLTGIKEIKLPKITPDHTFNQYTIKAERRDELKTFLLSKDIESVIYYPKPLNKQLAYYTDEVFPVAERLCKEVLSLPIHPYMNQDEIYYISEMITEFYK